MRVYLAAPLFTDAEREYNAKLKDLLTAAGHTVFLPQSLGLDQDVGYIYNQLRHELMLCDVVVAVLDGADVDSGTAWECGYADGRSKKVVGLRTDFRAHTFSSTTNLMLDRSAMTIVAKPEALIASLKVVPYPIYTPGDAS